MKWDRQICSVGLDPSWFPLGLEGKEAYVLGFVDELLDQISKRSHLDFVRINMSWDNTVDGLKAGKYHAIISAIPKNLETEKMFDFSDALVLTGPRLVVRADSKIKKLEEIKDGYIGCIKFSKEDLIIQMRQNVFPFYYNSTVQILQGVLLSEVDAGLVNGIPAISYVSDLYQDELILSEGPFGEDGIRFITKKNTNEAILKKFDKALEDYKKTKDYQNLLKKWMLN